MPSAMETLAVVYTEMALHKKANAVQDTSDKTSIEEQIHKLNSFRLTIKKLNKKFNSLRETLFKQQFKLIFKEHPGVEGFTWVQYTPYYCDGKPCVFTAYTGPSDLNLFTDVNVNNQQKTSIRNKISKILEVGTSDQELLDIFGDHAKIIVTQQGVCSEKYHHS